MPNWCFNYLRVTGPAEDVTRFQNQAEGFSTWPTSPAGPPPEVFNFQSLLPIPAEVLATENPTARQEAQRQHWGCRGGAEDAALVDEWEGGAIYEFATAWTPPLAFLEHLSRQWPTLLWELDYEEALAGFQGLAEAEAGVMEDHRLDLNPTDRTQ